MAEKKTTKKTTTKTTTRKPRAKKNPEAVVFRGEKYSVLEENEQKYKLTNGIIHFWASKKDVTAE